MANGNRRIYKHYKQAGYFTIPGYYNAGGKDNHCKICNCENRGTEGPCPDCYYKYCQERKQNKTIAGIAVRALSKEEWQVFQAIATQIMAHETPFATVEEYAEECRIFLEDEEQQSAKTLEQQRDTILYS